MEKYQDYVIKNGQFIGKFEEMYSKFDDPWRQKSLEHNVDSYSRNIAAINIRRYKIGSVVEFGCGLGFYTNFLQRTTGVKIKGVDISATAIQRARELWPSLDFEVGTVQDVERYKGHEAILFAEITWYILPDLKKILDSIYQNFRGGYLLHNLVFYKGHQQYGKEFFTNLEEFINFMPFQLLGYSEATTVDNDTLETHTIFKIENKD